MLKIFSMNKSLKAVAIAASFAINPSIVVAQSNPFAPGWILDQNISTLRFQSVKNSTKVESSEFLDYTGAIDENGLVTLKIKLDSVDTKVDLRNVRMRFLFFETFKFPEAIVSLQIDPEIIDDLQEVRRKVVNVPYSITLHGIESKRAAEIAVTLLNDDKVSITSSTPISLPIADFDLEDGLQKLQEAANVSILPSATVTFDFTFDKTSSIDEYQIAVAQQASDLPTEQVAIETSGDFDLAECKGRFEILSRTDNIYFGIGSARLDNRSTPILDSIYNIIERCPSLVVQVAGHTDSDGSETANQILSERRASSVRSYLLQAGVEEDRLTAIGYGETSPNFSNDTAENKARNRRIEFEVLN